ncbi:MAG: hypothetical protein HJJLKODD_00467 [Phycisphaerae bacterium]|nr:hypothetical protein [Phycisphaerae bacterium]
MSGQRRCVSVMVGFISCGLWAAGCSNPPGNSNQNDNQTNDNVVDNTNDNVIDNSNDNTPDNINDNVDSGNDNTSVEGEPLVTFETANFSGSGTCITCHNPLTDSTGQFVGIPDAWRATMMANAANDPFFLANVASEVARAPAELAGVIEDTCAACHMPMARTQATADGTPSLIFGDDGFLNPDNPLHDAALDGVSCTLCHQITNVGLGTSDSFSGGYVIDTTLQGTDRLIYGPFDDVDPATMQAAVQYTPTYSEHISGSALCATCHTLFTPTLNAAGEIVGTFPEQMAFIEWQNSSFGNGDDDDQTCQSCHMPVAEGSVVISPVPAGLDARSPFSQHRFRSANVFMLQMFRDNIEALGLTASSDQFDAALADARDFLENETATLEITSTEIVGNTLNITVRVENLTGHKFPTGFPARRAWIHLRAADSGAGETFFQSGPTFGDGPIQGNDADEIEGAFEPHYDMITSEDQVQIYESIMRNTDGDVTYTLLRGSTYAKDNRLLPSGLDKTTAPAEISSDDLALADENFGNAADIITYSLDITGRTGPFAIDAELLFQSVSHRFAIDLTTVQGEAIDNFAALYTAASKTPAVVASDSVTVE